MKEMVDLINHVLSTERMQGKYTGLFLLALLFLWLVPKDYSGRKGKKLALYSFVQVCMIGFAPLLLLILKATGFGQNYWEYLWTLPVLGVIAYAAVELCFMQQEKRIFRGAAAAVFVLLALSGTVLPFRADVEKWEYHNRNVEKVIRTVSEQKELYGGEVLLLAPEEILEQARAYDGGIHLVYGKDMWNAGANTAVADEYPQDICLLYEKMKCDYEYPDEMADAAKWYGCDVLVLREKLTAEGTQAAEWTLVQEAEGYVVYRYAGMEQARTE